MQLFVYYLYPTLDYEFSEFKDQICFASPYIGQEATIELDMEQQTGSKSGKEYIKAVHCHAAYLT